MQGMNHHHTSQASALASSSSSVTTASGGMPMGVIMVGGGGGSQNPVVKPRKLSKSELPFYESPALSTPTSSQIIKEAKQKLNDPVAKLKRHNTTAATAATVSGGHGAPASLKVTGHQPNGLSRHGSQENVQNQNGGGSGLIRTLSSNRPFTPREEKRNLFGPKSTRPVNERPPSSFGQIGSKSFETDINSSITFSTSSMNTSRPLSATRLSPISVDKQKPSSAAATTTSTSAHKPSFDANGEPDSLNKSLESLNSYLYLEALNSPKLIKCRLAPLPLETTKSTMTTTTTTTNGAGSRKQLEESASRRGVGSKNGSGKSLSSASSTGSSVASASDKQQQQQRPSVDASMSSRLSSMSISEAGDQVWTTAIEPLLLRIDKCYKENLPDEFAGLISKLNKLLEQNEMYSKHAFAKRSELLKIMFKYLDAENDRMRVSLSQIILNMKVSANNLTNICRLLFSISRNTENDVHFMDNDILDSILNAAKRLDFKANSDSVIYYCGTLKNLSENGKLLKQLSAKNLEDILTKIMKDLSKYFKENQTLKSEAGHVLVQLTATLRNLADLANTRPKFLSLNLIEHLVYVLKYYTSDSELMLNVSRILSKLTLHADCCQELVKHDSCYKSFVKLMLKHDSKQDLIVRVAFILGNLTSRHEEARLKYSSEKYSIDTLVNTLRVHLTATEGKALAGGGGGELEATNESEDVVIKLVRVVANLALNEQVGSGLANRSDIVELLIEILDTKSLASEELVLDTIITINNLSFYDSNLIINYSQKLIDTLMKYLLSNNNDAILEVFRVFANLSRHKAIRAYLVLRKVNALTIAYLSSSSNREILFIVIGVLINFMSDQENRFILKQENGVGKLIDILNEVGATDWQLSAMICKVLMNYSESVKPSAATKLSPTSYFEPAEIELLRLILGELLSGKYVDPKLDKPTEADEGEDEENIDEYIYYLWKQDFSPVAALLLNRLNEEASNTAKN